MMFNEGEGQRESEILVLIAALNEEEGIGLTLKELKGFLCATKFLVVDGNSEDQTSVVAKEFGAEVCLKRARERVMR